MKKLLYLFSMLLTLMSLSFLYSNQASATSSSLRNVALWNDLNYNQQDLFSQNDVVFYDPTECIKAEGGSSAAGLLSGKDNLEKIWNYLVKANINGVSNDAKVISGILGNLYVESGFNPFATNGTYYGIYQTDRTAMISKVNSQVGNYWGSTVDGEKNDKALEIELDDMVKENSRFKDFTDDLSKVKNKTPSSYAELFMLHVERCVYGEYSIKDAGVLQAMKDLYGHTNYQYQAGQKRCDKAEEIYKKYGSAATSSSTSSDSDTAETDSSTASGGGAAAINKSAIELAWPEGESHKKNDPKKAYKKVLKDSKLNEHSDSEVKIGASCDAFAKSVLYHSKVDQDFVCCGVGNQVKYMEDNPGTFKEVEGWTTQTAQAGDIVIKEPNAHIFIVVEVDGKLKRADASYEDSETPGRTGMIHNLYSSGTFRAWRVKGEAQNKGICSGSKSGNMDLNKTALELAWPADSGEHACNDVKPEFLKAALEVKSIDGPTNCSCVPNSACAWKKHGTSCSVWVSTVIRYSGVDRDINISPSGMLKHLQEKTEIFEEVTSGYGKDTMQAGDIQIYVKSESDGHVRMVVQTEDGKFHIAEASLGAAQPGQVQKKEYDGGLSNGLYRVFRAKNGVQSSPTSSSGGSASGGTNSIAKTALQLAWPKGTACTKESTPEYFKARMAVKIATETVYDPSKYKYPCSAIGASCDNFVGVVIRYSGVDPKAGHDVCEEGDTAEHCIVGRALRHPEIYENVTEGYSDEVAQDGDILASNGHTWIIAKLPEDGKLYKVEASNGNCCTGRVTTEYHHKENDGYGKVFVLRAKNQGGGVNCCSTDGSSDSGSGAAIKDGGYTSVSEANKAIMNPYKIMGNGITKYGAVDVGCVGGITSNCSAFSTYFVNRYFKTGATQVNGRDTVKHLISKGWKDGGHTPTVYAVFSQNSAACLTGSSNHTGVVLGIDQARDKIIIGEAGCSSPFSWTQARERSLKCFSKAPFTYAHPPSDPKGI